MCMRFTWEWFWEPAICSWGRSRDLTQAGLEWAGKGATVPSMDNVCLSWALLKVLLSSSAVPALSNCGVKHGSICRGTSLKKSCREGAVQVFRHEFEF